MPYWTGGRLTLQGNNPYDPQQVEQLQIAAGGVASGSYTISIMLNPPWTLPLLMPFSLLDYPTGRLTWLVFSIFLILLASHLLWTIYAGNPKKRWFYILLVVVFAPTISVLEVGQLAPYILIGIVGFLYFITSPKNDWLAGISLAIASIKPQIALLFWMAVLIWILQQRRWKIIISAAISVLVLTLIALLFDPHILQQYRSMLQNYQIADWANPTIGAYLRYFWFGTHNFWLQFLPSIVGGLWLVYYWLRHNKAWDWPSDLPLMLLVSQITSPYTWTYDQVILIPVIIQATLWITAEKKSKTMIFYLGTYLMLSILDLVLHMKLNDFWFIWLAPALLIWYLLLRRRNTLSAQNALA